MECDEYLTIPLPTSHILTLYYISGTTRRMLIVARAVNPASVSGEVAAAAVTAMRATWHLRQVGTHRSHGVDGSRLCLSETDPHCD